MARRTLERVKVNLGRRRGDWLAGRGEVVAVDAAALDNQQLAQLPEPRRLSQAVECLALIVLGHEAIERLRHCGGVRCLGQIERRLRFCAEAQVVGDVLRFLGIEQHVRHAAAGVSGGRV